MERFAATQSLRAGPYCPIDVPLSTDRRTGRPAEKETDRTGTGETTVWLPAAADSAAASRRDREPQTHIPAAGLSVKRKKRKRLVRGGQPQLTASAPDQQWAIDFVHDRLASGRTIRMLTVVDAFTRECLALEVDSSLPSRRVTRALDSVIFQRGRPESIRMDNGSELTSRHFLAWGIDRRINLAHIQPGKPVQNAFIESFNGRVRATARCSPVRY
jgi:transposase InsO family protein